MKEKLRQSLSQFKNNRGVGIITVVIVVAFLVVLGSLVLFTSYNGFRSKTSAREGEERFYDAEAAMNQIQAELEVQEALAFTDAYSTVLTQYASFSQASSEDQEKANEAFANSFLTGLRNAVGKTASEDEEAIKLFQLPDEDEDGSYNCEGLKSFVSVPEGTSVSVVYGVDSSTSGKLVIDKDSDPMRIILKDVSVTCVSGDHKSTVKADLIMPFPQFSYLESQFLVSDVTSFGLIADEGLTVTGGTETKPVAVECAAYSAGVDVNAGAALSFNSERYICAGDINLGMNSLFSSVGNTELWTNNIEVGKQAKANLSGTSYVADDLNLAENEAAATLTGRYFGFGDSLTLSSESSAILANGHKTTLDIAGLQTLMLSGYSFISTMDELLANAYRDAGISASEIGTNDVRMGESISVKSNQRIYLVPAADVRYYDGNTLASVSSNPTIANNATEVRKMLSGAEIRTTDEALTGARVKTLAQPVGGDQWIVYFFMEFTDPDEANAYFKDYTEPDRNYAETYFMSDNSNLKKYVDDYITITSAAQNYDTAGYTFINNPESEKIRVYNYDPSRQSTEGYVNEYANLCSTLTEYPINNSLTPYQYIVDTEKVEALNGGSVQFQLEGETLAVVVDNNGESDAPYVYSGTAEQQDLTIIIASGDVELTKSFNGLIIAGGKVTLTQALGAAESLSVTNDALNVALATTASAANGDKVDKYLNFVFGSSEGEGEGSTKSFEIRVLTENWQKD